MVAKFCDYIALAKKFIWDFPTMLWKNLSELFGQPNTKNH